jgi:hypothetical protein
MEDHAMRFTIVTRPTIPQSDPVRVAILKTLTSGKAVRITTNGQKHRHAVQVQLWNYARKSPNALLRCRSDGPDSLIAWMEKKS